MAITEKYLDFELATGANDGTSPADAWRTLAAVVWTAGTRINAKNPSSRFDITATSLTVTDDGSDTAGPIEFRGYGTTIGDGVKCQVHQDNASGYWFFNNTGMIIRNFDITSRVEGGAALRFAITGSTTALVSNVKVVNTLNDPTLAANAVFGREIKFHGCYFESGSSTHVTELDGGNLIDSVVKARNNTRAVLIDNNSRIVVLVNNLITGDNNSSYAIDIIDAKSGRGCKIEYNTIDGFNTGIRIEEVELPGQNSSIEIQNNTFANCGKVFSIDQHATQDTYSGIWIKNNSFFNIGNTDNSNPINSPAESYLISDTVGVSTTANTGILSITVDKATDDIMYPIAIGTGDPGIVLNVDGSVNCDLKNSGGTTLASLTSAANLVTSLSGLHVITVAWDNVLEEAYMYLGNAQVASDTVWTAGAPRSDTEVFIGRLPGNVGHFRGILANAYYADNHSLDIEGGIFEADLRSFVTDQGMPGDLKNAPAARIKYSGVATAWDAGTNEGTDDDATVTGTFTDLNPAFDEFIYTFQRAGQTGDETNITKNPFVLNRVHETFDGSGDLDAKVTSDGDHTWNNSSNEGASEFQIDSSGRLTHTGSGTIAASYLTTDFGGQDLEISLDTYGNSGTGNSSLQLMFRANNNNFNFGTHTGYYINVDGDGDTIQIVRRDTSSATVLTTTTKTLVYPMNVKVNVVGDDITATVTWQDAGVEVVTTITATDSTYSDGEFVGVRADHNSTSFLFFDNYTVRAAVNLLDYRPNTIAGGGILLRDNAAYGGSLETNFQDTGVFRGNPGDDLGVSENIAIDLADINVVGLAVNINAVENIAIDLADINVAAPDVNVNAIENIAIDLADINIATFDVNINETENVSIDISDITIAALDVNVIENILIDVADINVAALDVNVNAIENIAVDLVDINLATPDVNINETENIAIDVATIPIAALDININAIENIAVDLADINVVAPDVNVNAIENIAIDISDITIAALDVNINETENIAIDLADVTITTFDVNVIENIEIDAASITIIAPDININAIENISVDLADINVVAPDVNVNAIENIAIDVADVTITAFDVNINAVEDIAIDISDITIAALDVNVIENIVIDTADINVVAPDVNVNAVENIAIDVADVTINTPDVNINAIENIAVDLTNITITALAVNVGGEENIVIDISDITIAALDVNINASENIAIDVADITIAALDVNVNAIDNIEIDAADINVVAPDVQVGITEDIAIDLANISITTFDITIGESEDIAVDLADINVAAPAVNINAVENIAIDLADVTIAALDVTVLAVENIEIDVADISIVALDPIVNAIENIAIDLVDVTIVAPAVTINETENIAIDLADVTLTTFDVNVIENIEIETATIGVFGRSVSINGDAAVGRRAASILLIS